MQQNSSGKDMVGKGRPAAGAAEEQVCQ